MLHNENSRVKTPALVHFTRLGYEHFNETSSKFSTYLFISRQMAISLGF